MKLSLNDLLMGTSQTRRRLMLIVYAIILSIPVAAVSMQTAAAPTVARVMGTVTAIDGNTVTVKTDAGASQKVTIQDSTRMLQTAPGQTNLSGATAIHVQDLEVGDRLSARGAMSEDGASLAAVSLIAMKQADVQKKQEADRADWQTRGISGVVKQVDPAAATVTVAIGTGAAARTLTVHTGKATIVRRYSSDSAKLSDAKPSSLDLVKTGDELRARGTRNADGSELAAEEMVVGSFRNLAGVITAVDRSAGTISLTDLATKKPYVILCGADSQLRKLPPAMAQMLAARLKGTRPAGMAASSSATGAAGSGPAGAHGETASNSPSKPINRDQRSEDQGGGDHQGGVYAGGEHSAPRDPQQVLNRAPAIKISDLQKGDAVIVVTTEGTAAGPGPAAPAVTSTAITLIAGVEPMLQASASGSQDLLSSAWSLGSGAAGGDGPQ